MILAGAGISIRNQWLDDAGSVSFRSSVSASHWIYYTTDWKGYFDYNINWNLRIYSNLYGGSSYLYGSLLSGSEYTGSSPYVPSILSLTGLGNPYSDQFRLRLYGTTVATLVRDQVAGVNHNGDYVLLRSTLGAATHDARLVCSDGTVHPVNTNTHYIEQLTESNGRLPGQPGWWKLWHRTHRTYPKGLSLGGPGE